MMRPPPFALARTRLLPTFQFPRDYRRRQRPASVGFKEHDTAAVFGGENNSLANRPLIIAAFPLSIQYLPVIHSKHIVGRGMTDNRTPIPLLLKIVRK